MSVWRTYLVANEWNELQTRQARIHESYCSVPHQKNALLLKGQWREMAFLPFHPSGIELKDFQYF